jgi:DNA-binding NarL/FixJ family response regulator
MSLERILVCAEPSSAERFADALRAHGYDAETASDRAAALTLTETTHPAIVLTWSDLPETEIVGFVQRLGELSPRPRVAVVVRDEDMERCGDLLEAGVDALLLDDPEMTFLLSSLHRLRGGGLVVDPSLARALVARADAGSRASELGSVSEVEDPPGGPGDAATEVRVVEFQDCDLAEVVRTSVAEAALAFPLITVEVHTPPALPAVGEPEALQGVVRILVDNACRRTSSGSSVTVKAKKAVEGLTVSVTTRGSGGNGEELGLDLARSLVALHGGILWSEPLPAGGTRLLFTLPPKPPALADEEREAAIQALELLAGIGARPEAAPPVEEAATEEPQERLGDLDVLDTESDEVDPMLDLTDIPDRTAADEVVTPTPESLQSVPEVEPDSSVSAEMEVGPDESEPDLAPDMASEEVDVDVPLEPVDHPPTVEVEGSGPEPEPLEEPAGNASEAEAPPAEAETVAGESRLRRKWKHRRPRWRRTDPKAPSADEPADVEPLEEQPHDAPADAEAPPTGDVLEVEPVPAAPAGSPAEVDTAEPALEVAPEEVPVDEKPPEEVLVAEAPLEEALIEEAPPEVLPDLQPQGPPDDHPSELPVEVEAAAEEPGTSEDEPVGPPDYEEPETPTIEIPDPEPVASSTAAVTQESGQAPELPPRPFVPDPFDPATQMLRSLALDRDDDDAPPDPFRAQRGK